MELHTPDDLTDPAVRGSTAALTLSIPAAGPNVTKVGDIAVKASSKNTIQEIAEVLGLKEPKLIFTEHNVNPKLNLVLTLANLLVEMTAGLEVLIGVPKPLTPAKFVSDRMLLRKRSKLAYRLGVELLLGTDPRMEEVPIYVEPDEEVPPNLKVPKEVTTPKVLKAKKVKARKRKISIKTGKKAKPTKPPSSEKKFGKLTRKAKNTRRQTEATDAPPWNLPGSQDAPPQAPAVRTLDNLVVDMTAGLEALTGVPKPLTPAKFVPITPGGNNTISNRFSNTSRKK